MLRGDDSVFNQPLSDWRVDKVKTMSYMFADNDAFNQDISGWRVDQVTSMQMMFNDASAFDQDLGWCVDDSVKLVSDWGGAFDGTPCASTSCGLTQVDDCPAPAPAPPTSATCAAALGSDDAKARSVAFGLLVTVALLGVAF